MTEYITKGQALYSGCMDLWKATRSDVHYHGVWLEH